MLRNQTWELTPTMDAASWDRMFEAKEQLFSPDPNAIVVELVSALKPGHALDLGAGEGRHAVWLARQGWRVTAIDFSPVALERTRRRAAAAGLDIECVLADADDVAPPTGGFDLNARPDDDWRWTPRLLADAFPGIELERCETMIRHENPDGVGFAVDTLVWGHRPHVTL